jgi:hypothetical protein
MGAPFRLRFRRTKWGPHFVFELELMVHKIPKTKTKWGPRFVSTVAQVTSKTVVQYYWKQ